MEGGDMEISPLKTDCTHITLESLCIGLGALIPRCEDHC